MPAKAVIYYRWIILQKLQFHKLYLLGVIDLSGIPEGIYYLNYSNQSGVSTTKKLQITQ